MRSLTDRQKEVLEYLRGYHGEKGLMPSTREIQKHFGFASQTGALFHLRALERKKAIQRLPGQPRAIVFPGDLNRGPLIDIPIYRRIVAGAATDCQREILGKMTMDMASLGLSAHTSVFALLVNGLSMIGAHILPDDLVIFENRKPQDKDIVAALIDGETTLKRYMAAEGMPALQSEQSGFSNPLSARGIIIQGVMVGLIRNTIPPVLD